MNRAKISVILPAYNESAMIVETVSAVIGTLSYLDYDFEVIVVDDGSCDGTHLRAATIWDQYKNRLRIVRYDRNSGKGNALVCGTRYASGDYVVFLDADMDLHPRQLPRFFEILEATGADVVVGSKRHPESIIDYPLYRRLYSMVYYALVRILFRLPIRDTQTGLKVFKISVLHRVFSKTLVKRFAFDLEVLANARRLGYKITEAPVQVDFQRSVGRIKWQDILVILRDTAAIFYRMNVRRYYDTESTLDFSKSPCDSQSRELTDLVLH